MKTHRHASLHRLTTSAGASPVASSGRQEPPLGLRAGRLQGGAERHPPSLADGDSGPVRGSRESPQPRPPPSASSRCRPQPPAPGPPPPGIELPGRAWGPEVHSDAQNTAVRWAAEDAQSRGRRETPRSWAETAGQTSGRGEGRRRRRIKGSGTRLNAGETQPWGWGRCPGQRAQGPRTRRVDRRVWRSWTSTWLGSRPAGASSQQG